MNCNSIETINTERWKQLETKTKDWKGAEGLHVHERYYITLSSKQSLKQTRIRKEKEMLQKAPAIPDQQDLQEKEYQPESPKRSQSSIGGLLYYKNKCVW